MKLQITLQQAPNNPAPSTTVFWLDGTTAQDWLYQLSQLGCDLTQLLSFVMTSSEDKTLGLFVWMQSGNVPVSTLLSPYFEAGPGVFIPQATALFPKVRTEEWASVFTWDVHIFHPGFGFWGFHRSDSFNWKAAITLHQSAGTAWDMAQPPVADRVPLKKIELLKPPDPFSRFRDSAAQRQTMDYLQDLDQQRKELFEKLRSVSDREGANSSSSNALQNELSELDKKRNETLQQLLSMFDNDSDEALLHAPPLNSPYLHRGTGTSGSSLGTNSTDFRLSGLGGGHAGDRWKVGGDIKHALQQRYEAAAKKALDDQDFRKAAYIYAHLLGNYHLAANVLKQGGFYREAAVLYEDHLKKPVQAAECLELGGCLTEAIAIYETLDRFEKCGDLYDLIEDTFNSHYFWKKAADIHLQKDNHLEAAKIHYEKITDHDAALDLLASGWAQSANDESCLKQYFEIIGTRYPSRLVTEIQSLYFQKTRPEQQKAFLNILVGIAQKHYQKTEAMVTATQIAYQITESCDDEQLLFRLKAFMPTDQLLDQDVSLYVNRPNRKKQHIYLNTLQLPNDIEWLFADHFFNELVILGNKNEKELVLMRINWKGQQQLKTIGTILPGSTDFQCIKSTYQTAHLLLTSKTPFMLDQPGLDADTNFSSPLTIINPDWVPSPAGYGFDETGHIVVLKSIAENTIKEVYNINRSLISSVSLSANETHSFQLPIAHPDQPSLLLAGPKQLFTFQKNILLLISPYNTVKVFHFEREIYQIALNQRAHTTDIFVVGAFGIAVASYPSMLHQPDDITPSIMDIDGYKMIILYRKYGILYNSNEIKVYDISFGKMHFLWESEFPIPVVSVFETQEYNYLGVLFANGKIIKISLKDA